IGGLIATQLACLGWALGSTFSKRHPGAADPLSSAAFQMLAGGLVLLTAAAVTGEFGHVAWSTRSVLAMGYLFVAGSLIGFVAYIYALTHLPISVVSLYPYVNPVVAVLLGTWLLHEPISWRIVAAIGVILGGSAIVTRRRRPDAAGAASVGASRSVAGAALPAREDASRTSPAATAATQAAQPVAEVESAERCA
ncbi:MAG: EamA family transporter, partial [Acidobacteria bacterium]|nr:EamA family transporter [Acidobacteriota bacterium]